MKEELKMKPKFPLGSEVSHFEHLDRTHIVTEVRPVHSYSGQFVFFKYALSGFKDSYFSESVLISREGKNKKIRAQLLRVLDACKKDGISIGESRVIWAWNGSLPKGFSVEYKSGGLSFVNEAYRKELSELYKLLDEEGL